MEFCGLGSIADLISQEKERKLFIKEMNEEKIQSVLASVVRGLLYLHSKVLCLLCLCLFMFV